MVNVYLRDYLRPGGRYPYDRLPLDLEGLLTAGCCVVLLSVPGFPMLYGHPDLQSRRWHDGDGVWYESASDCLAGRHGLRID